MKTGTIKKGAVGTAREYVGQAVTILDDFNDYGGHVIARDGKMFPVLEEEVENVVESNRRFKAGDHVILQDTARQVGVPTQCIGGEAVVRGPHGDSSYYVDMVDRYNGAWGWSVNDYMLEPVHNNQKIVVTTDGKETLARMYENGQVVKKATARCSDEDDFNFETGARIALSRLISGEEEPKGYTGRFVVTGKRARRTATPGITIGRIYEARDGKFIDDDGSCRPFTRSGMTLDDISSTVGYNIVEIKED